MAQRRFKVARRVCLQESVERASDGSQAKLFGMDVGQGDPHQFCRIIARLGFQAVGHAEEEEGVQRRHLRSAIAIDVGDGEEILRLLRQRQSGLLQYLAHHAFLQGLACVAEAARQVERAPSGFFLAPLHEQFAVCVEDEGCRGTTGVEEILKPTIAAAFAFCRALFEMLAATDGAVAKFV